MGLAVKYKKEIINITRDLPGTKKLKELINFAQFLKAKEEEFSYTDVIDSAACEQNEKKAS